MHWKCPKKGSFGGGGEILRVKDMVKFSKSNLPLIINSLQTPRKSYLTPIC